MSKYKQLIELFKATTQSTSNKHYRDILSDISGVEVVSVSYTGMKMEFNPEQQVIIHLSTWYLGTSRWHNDALRGISRELEPKARERDPEVTIDKEDTWLTGHNKSGIKLTIKSRE